MAAIKTIGGGGGGSKDNRQTRRLVVGAAVNLFSKVFTFQKGVFYTIISWSNCVNNVRIYVY